MTRRGRTVTGNRRCSAASVATHPDRLSPTIPLTLAGLPHRDARPQIGEWVTDPPGGTGATAIGAGPHPGPSFSKDTPSCDRRIWLSATAPDFRSTENIRLWPSARTLLRAAPAPATAVCCTHLRDVNAVRTAVASIPRSAQVQTPALATKSDVSTRHTTTVDGVVAGRPTTVRRTSQRWGATGGAPRTSPPSPVPSFARARPGRGSPTLPTPPQGRRSLQARIRNMADLAPLHSI